MTPLRTQLQHQMLGEHPPRLWCPPITHYRDDGTIDRERMSEHFAHMAPHVKGFLVPGSTGDAWEMSPAELEEVVDLSLDLAAQHGTLLLLGALRPTTHAASDAIERMLAKLMSRSRCDDPIAAMKQNRVCGFVVCGPTGRELSQDQIEAGLSAVLSMNLPTALYQLPQITKNELSPALVQSLAGRFENIILFKDSGGADTVALAHREAVGPFFVRGSEGRYAPFLREAGGPYDGLLLSTANSLAPQLSEVITLLENKRTAEAIEVSDRLTRAVDRVFALAATIPHGNAFANANKAMDHLLAFGGDALNHSAPRLHAGVRLPAEMLREARSILAAESLLPDRGYLS